MTILDPRPRLRPRAPAPSAQQIQEIRAQRAREKQYREYADYMSAYQSGAQMPMSGLRFANASHFRGLGGYPAHFGDAGGSGATLPPEVTADPDALNKRKALTTGLWVGLAVLAGVGLTVAAVRSFK